MTRDLPLALRQAIVAALEDSPAVTAIVPVERIHATQPPALPARPFVRYGLAAARPLRASGLGGVRIVGALHGHAAGPQEDAASALGAALAAVLDGADGRGALLDLGLIPAATAHLGSTGSRLLRDGDEAGAYQIVVGFEATIVEAR